MSINKFTGKFEITGDDLKGLKNLSKVLQEYKKHYVKVGVLGGNYADGTPIAQVAAMHEFGTEATKTFEYKGESITIHGLPTRSFLRVPLKTHKSQLKGKGYLGKENFLRVMLKEMQHGYTGVALEFLGINAINIVRGAFSTSGYGQWLENQNKKYIALKGSSKPLIDTGYLESATKHEVI